MDILNSKNKITPPPHSAACFHAAGYPCLLSDYVPLQPTNRSV